MKSFGIGSTAIARPAAVAFFIALSVGAPAQAEQQAAAKLVEAGLIVEDVGAAERINFSGKLRMLSQRIPAAACNLASGVEVELSRKILSSAKDEFNKILTGLQMGDEDLGIIGVEKRRKTLVAIEALQAEWSKFYTAVNALLDGDDVEKQLTFISEHNLPLLDLAKLLVSEISGQYSNPAEMTQANAMLVDISGRQRMLSQKIAKESCAIATNHPKMGDAEQLGKTVAIFDASLNALKDGMAAAGINPPPTDEIQTGLNGIWDQWQVVKADLDQLSDADKHAESYRLLNVVLKEMNAVVGLYTSAAKSEI